jgi:hypothetical protein
MLPLQHLYSQARLHICIHAACLHAPSIRPYIHACQHTHAHESHHGPLRSHCRHRHFATRPNGESILAGIKNTRGRPHSSAASPVGTAVRAAGQCIFRRWQCGVGQGGAGWLRFVHTGRGVESGGVHRACRVGDVFDLRRTFEMEHVR